MIDAAEGYRLWQLIFFGWTVALKFVTRVTSHTWDWEQQTLLLRFMAFCFLMFMVLFIWQKGEPSTRTLTLYWTDLKEEFGDRHMIKQHLSPCCLQPWTHCKTFKIIRSLCFSHCTTFCHKLEKVHGNHTVRQSKLSSSDLQRKHRKVEEMDMCDRVDKQNVRKPRIIFVCAAVQQVWHGYRYWTLVCLYSAIISYYCAHLIRLSAW